MWCWCIKYVDGPGVTRSIVSVSGARRLTTGLANELGDDGANGCIRTRDDGEASDDDDDDGGEEENVDGGAKGSGGDGDADAALPNGAFVLEAARERTAPGGSGKNLASRARKVLFGSRSESFKVAFARSRLLLSVVLSLVLAVPVVLIVLLELLWFSRRDGCKPAITAKVSGIDSSTRSN